MKQRIKEEVEREKCLDIGSIEKIQNVLREEMKDTKNLCLKKKILEC
jgi:hypothetical protein